MSDEKTFTTDSLKKRIVYVIRNKNNHNQFIGPYTFNHWVSFDKCKILEGRKQANNFLTLSKFKTFGEIIAIELSQPEQE